MSDDGPDPGYGEQRATEESRNFCPKCGQPDNCGDCNCTPNEVEADVATYSAVTQIAIEELIDSGLGSNIARRHHLESAIECFDRIKVLIEAEKIVKELLVPEVEQ